jgi:hypothetical protein
MFDSLLYALNLIGRSFHPTLRRRQQPTINNHHQRPTIRYKHLPHSQSARLSSFRQQTTLVSLLLSRCCHDYSRPLLYLRQGDWQQMGDVLESLASGLFRRVRVLLLSFRTRPQVWQPVCVSIAPSSTRPLTYLETFLLTVLLLFTLYRQLQLQ